MSPILKYLYTVLSQNLLYISNAGKWRLCLHNRAVESQEKRYYDQLLTTIVLLLLAINSDKLHRNFKDRNYTAKWHPQSER